MFELKIHTLDNGSIFQNKIDQTIHSEGLERGFTDILLSLGKSQNPQVVSVSTDHGLLRKHLRVAAIHGSDVTCRLCGFCRKEQYDQGRSDWSITRQLGSAKLVVEVTFCAL